MDRSHARIGGVVASLLVGLASAPTAAAAPPDRSQFEHEMLIGQYGTVAPGTGDFIQVWVDANSCTHNGVVISDARTFTVTVGRRTTNDAGDDLTVWIGGYEGSDRQVSFGVRDVVAEGTRTWQCFAGACPTMPASVHFRITATPQGGATTEVSNTSGDTWRTHFRSQRFEATITVDTGGAISLLPLADSYIVRSTETLVTAGL